MTKLFLFLLTLILEFSIGTTSLYCQNALNLGAISSYTGSKMRIEYSKSWEDHTLAFGVQYLLNSRVHDLKDENYLKRRFYASRFTQHLGISFNYTYELIQLFNTTPLTLAYDFQFVRADLLGDRFLPKEIIDGVQYFSYINKMDPAAISLENNLCLGIKLPVTDRLTFYQKLGGGIASFHGLDSNLRASISREFDFSYLISFTINFRL